MYLQSTSGCLHFVNNEEFTAATVTEDLRHNPFVVQNCRVSRACNLTSFSPCLTGPVDYPFSSCHKGPGFKTPGGTYVKPGILLLALSRYKGLSCSLISIPKTADFSAFPCTHTQTHIPPTPNTLTHKHTHPHMDKLSQSKEKCGIRMTSHKMG